MFLKLKLALPVLLVTFLNSYAFGQKQPNIVVILVDDLGYGDLSCYGNQQIKTTQIDQLASDGIRLTHFYAAAGICSPTRASILTGRYPFRIKFTHYLEPTSTEHLPLHTITLPKLLQTKGYYTAHVGKWHMGGVRKEDVTKRKSNGNDALPGPLQLGFDYYMLRISDGLAGSDSLNYWNAGQFLAENDILLPEIKGHYTDLTTDFGIKVVEEAKRSKRPFFLNLWYFAPHAPYNTTPEPFQQQAKGTGIEPPNSHYDFHNHAGEADRYNALILHLDNNVGRFIAKLKELKMYDNTIIIFASDNGAAYRGSNDKFAGAKGDVYDGGVRVPCIVTWKKKIPSNQVNDLLGSTVDFLPTLAYCAGVDPINIGEMDGVNLLPPLQQNLDSKSRTLLWCMDFFDTQFAPGNKKEPKSNAAYMRWPYKIHFRNDLPIQNPTAVALYNIETDPYETTDLLAVDSNFIFAAKSLTTAFFDEYLAIKTNPSNDKQEDFILSPIISHGKLRVLLPNIETLTFMIYRLDGTLVRSRTLNELDIHSFDLIIEKSGMYIFVLQTASERKTKRFWVY